MIVVQYGEKGQGLRIDTQKERPMEEKVIMLTQKSCPKCIKLKNYLEHDLNNDYADRIRVVCKESDKSQFMKIVRKYGIMSTPVLIFKDEVLRDTCPDKVMEFLKNI